MTDKATPPPKPKYQVVEDKLYTQTADGEIVIPLRFKTRLLREVKKMEGLEELDQLYWLLEAIGDHSTVERLDELDVFETLGIVGRYFAEFEKRQEATLGEFSGLSKNSQPTETPSPSTSVASESTPETSPAE